VCLSDGPVPRHCLFEIAQLPGDIAHGQLRAGIRIIRPAFLLDLGQKRPRPVILPPSRCILSHEQHGGKPSPALRISASKSFQDTLGLRSLTHRPEGTRLPQPGLLGEIVVGEILGHRPVQPGGLANIPALFLNLGLEEKDPAAQRTLGILPQKILSRLQGSPAAIEPAGDDHPLPGR